MIKTIPFSEEHENQKGMVIKMELIIGGSFQGKLDYVLESKNIGIEDCSDGESSDWEDLCNKPVLNHFHLLVKRWMTEGIDISSQITKLLDRNQEVIIITNEIGYGIVPMDAFERSYREKTGRICCNLAKQADCVTRIVSGIATVLKES